MRRLLGILALMFVALTPTTQAQQLNVGLSKRYEHSRPVADFVLMAPELPVNYIKSVIFYAQVTATNTYDKPELYAAAEIPLINTKAVYLGFDNGIGTSATNGKYGEKLYFTGLTSWVPVNKYFGVYGMLSFVPKQDWSRTVQVGVFHRVF